MTKDKLIDEARGTAHCYVIERGGSVWVGRNGRGAAEVVIREDGSIMRSDVRADLALRITPTQAAHVLALGE